MELFEANMNYKNKPEYKKEKYLCDSCESQIDHNSHVLFCPSYSGLRQEKNLNDDGIDFVFLDSTQIGLIKDDLFDLAINTMSFAEMDHQRQFAIQRK